MVLLDRLGPVGGCSPTPIPISILGCDANATRMGMVPSFVKYDSPIAR